MGPPPPHPVPPAFVAILRRLLTSKSRLRGLLGSRLDGAGADDDARDALERSEIRALSPAERQELSTATRRALELGCAPDGPRKARCTEQAELLLSLEECDPACRDFARTFVARPTR